MDGWITIGTKLDSKQLQRDLIKAENELKKYDKQAQKLTDQEAKIKTKIEFDDQDYKNKVNRLEKRLENELKANEVGGIIKNEDSIRAKYDDLFQRLEETQEIKATKNNMQLEEIHQKMEENTKEQERLNNKIQETESLLNKAKGSFDLKGTIENIGNSITKVTKKVVKWGLAIFGVRSAYYFVRQAMSTLAQYDDQLATDIQYIRFALAMTLKPLIEEIIKLVYKLLNFIAYVVKLFTGKNIFENSGVDKFQEYMDKSNKSAKELKKTIAGFDEMNILNDNSSGGSLGTNLPSDDLKEIGEVDISTSNLQKWIKKAKKIVDDGFKEIRKKVSGWMKKMNFSDEFIGYWELGIEGVHKIFDGFVDFVNGILEVIVGIFSGDIEKIKKGFKDMFKGIKEFFKGFCDTLSGGFGMLVQGIIDIFKKLPEIIYNLFFKKSDKDFETFKNDVKNKFDEIFKKAQDVFYNILNTINNTIDKIRNKMSDLGRSAGDVIGGALKSVVNGILGSVENILNKPINAINGLITSINKLPNIKFSKLSTIKLPRLAKGGIINLPGRGVPIGGTAIAGESGKEAVLPLQDTQVLQQIADAIGQRITINATIVNSMNGRVLNRELQKIQNQSSFATNGR